MSRPDAGDCWKRWRIKRLARGIRKIMAATALEKLDAFVISATDEIVQAIRPLTIPHPSGIMTP